ncbi:YaaW family protein [Dechloromonas sp. H13]|uniref:YaaW family protein n=1 Tax=Dechloromonas sp. H13 TaxID=2570193 RepID=UPI00129228DB|nr:YaaW family protein [Dechloromonas sp. H13]
MSSETLTVIRWAHRNADSNEVVKLFWEKLCDAVNQKSNATADKIYAELRLYGSNSLRQFDRPEGVTYHEVAKDVADKLAPLLKSSPYGYETIEACERYVLEKMDIRASEIEKICAGIGSEGEIVASKEVAGKGVVIGVAMAIAISVAEMIALRIASALAGAAVGGVLAVVFLTGPAYRCTIPGVVYVSLLRQMYSASQKGL